MADVRGGGGQIHGGTPHATPDAGNPVKRGGRARDTAITPVANDDRVDQVMSTTGGALVAGQDGGVPRDIAVNAAGELKVSFVKGVLNQSKRFVGALANQTIISGSGVRLVIHSILVITDNDNASSMKINIGFGGGITPDENSADNIFAAGELTRGKEVPRHGGSAPIGEGALNQNLLFTSTIASGPNGNVNVMVTYSTFV